MTGAQTLIIAVLICLLVSGLAFVTRPQTGNDTLKGFLLANRTLRQGGIVASLTGTNAALANIIFLYAYWGFTYGIAAAFWGAVFWIAGLLVFFLALRRGRLAELLGKNQTALGLNEIAGTQFIRRRFVTFAAAIASGLAFLFLLSLEVGVGSNAAVRLVTAAPAASSGYSPEALLIGGGLVVFVSAYGYIGGFQMVVRTDVWQSVLIFSGLACSLVLSDAVLNLHELSLGEVIRNGLDGAILFSWNWSLAPFAIGSIFSWGVWFICTMDSWQRALAADPDNRVRINTWAIVAGTALLIAVSSISVLLGMTVKEIWASPVPPRYPIIEFIELAKPLLENTTLAFLMAVMMGGFLAAMASTVDTYMLIIGQSLAGDTATSVPLSESTGDAQGRRLRIIRIAGLTTPVIGLAAFAAAHMVAQQDNFTLYMLAGSLPMSLMPLCAWMIWGARNTERKLDGFWTSTGILCALVVSVVLNYAIASRALATFDEKLFGLLYFIPFLTAVVAAIFLFIDMYRSRRSNAGEVVG